MKHSRRYGGPVMVSTVEHQREQHAREKGM